MKALHALIALTLGSAAGAGAGFGAHRVVPRSPFVVGLVIAGQRAPARDVAAWLRARAETADERAVVFRSFAGDFATTRAALGVHVDVEATLAAARAVGHRGGPLSRLRETEVARRGAIDVPWVVSVDESAARKVIASFAERVDRPAVDARLDLEHHSKIPEQNGETLDVDASLEAFERAPREDGDETIALVTRRTPARVSADDLVNVDVSKVVSSYETNFTVWGFGANRAINIETAASHLDGLVLAPGATMSFNDVVGPRTKERGFALAPELQGDDTTQGYGGGTCQMSSTLHAAALFGALEIVEREAHSRPSSYTSMGLDATVVYPAADLKIRNTLPFPIMIHAFFPKPTSVRVEILGGDPVAKVDYVYGVGSSEDFMRRVVVKSYLHTGQHIRHQKGSRGFDVNSIATVRYVDGRVEERRWFSGYRPAPEIFWVAPDTKDSDLPPLPEHAKGVEGRLADGDG